MAKPEVVMDIAGCDAIRNSLGVQSALLSIAKSIASKATSMDCECSADVRAGKKRAHARVKTSGAKAAKNNAEHNTLLKSLDAGRR